MDGSRFPLSQWRPLLLEQRSETYFAVHSAGHRWDCQNAQSSGCSASNYAVGCFGHRRAAGSHCSHRYSAPWPPEKEAGQFDEPAVISVDEYCKKVVKNESVFRKVQRLNSIFQNFQGNQKITFHSFLLLVVLHLHMGNCTQKQKQQTVKFTASTGLSSIRPVQKVLREIFYAPIQIQVLYTISRIL